MKLETSRRASLPGLSSFFRGPGVGTVRPLNVCDATRLLEQLLEKEREYQSILQQVLEEREQEIRLLRLRSEPAGRCLRQAALPPLHTVPSDEDSDDSEFPGSNLRTELKSLQMCTAPVQIK